MQRDAPHADRRVLAPGELHCGLVARAFQIQGVHRSAVRAWVVERIRVNRNEQVSPVFAGNGHAITMFHENVAVANQHGPHSGLGIDAPRQFFADGQNDVFFLGSPADGARITAAMPGIYRDDDIPTGPVRLRRPFDWPQIARRLQINDQAITVLRIRTGRETARAHPLPEIQHNSQLAVRTHRAADRAHHSGARGQLGQRLGQTAVFEIDNDAIRTAQGKNRVIDGLAEIQNNACFIVLGPDSDVFDRRRGICRRIQQQKQGYQGRSRHCHRGIDWSIQDYVG